MEKQVQLKLLQKKNLFQESLSSTSIQKGSQCVILLQNEFHDKTDGFVHYTYEK